MGAAPIGSPGCPDLAFSTASTAKKRTALIQSSSRDWEATTIMFFRMNYKNKTRLKREPLTDYSFRGIDSSIFSKS